MNGPALNKPQSSAQERKHPVCCGLGMNAMLLVEGYLGNSLQSWL